MYEIAIDPIDEIIRIDNSADLKKWWDENAIAALDAGCTIMIKNLFVSPLTI